MIFLKRLASFKRDLEQAKRGAIKKYSLGQLEDCFDIIPSGACHVYTIKHEFNQFEELLLEWLIIKMKCSPQLDGTKTSCRRRIILLYHESRKRLIIIYSSKVQKWNLNKCYSFIKGINNKLIA